MALGQGRVPPSGSTSRDDEHRHLVDPDVGRGFGGDGLCNSLAGRLGLRLTSRRTLAAGDAAPDGRARTYVATGEYVQHAAELVGIRPSTVKRHLADLRARSGLTTEQLIYAGRASEWLFWEGLEPTSAVRFATDHRGRAEQIVGLSIKTARPSDLDA